jgi:hypothetical protein
MTACRMFKSSRRKLNELKWIHQNIENKQKTVRPFQFLTRKTIYPIEEQKMAAQRTATS